MSKDCFCWTCADYKEPSEMSKDKALFKGVCAKCEENILQDLKKANAKIIIKHDKEAVFNIWVNAYVNYSCVSVEVNKIKYFIRKYHTGDDSHDLGQVVELIKKFIKSGFKSYWRYGDPEALKTYDFWFSLSKSNGNFYHLHGNCYEYSSAFSFASTDPEDVFNIIGYHNKISKDMQKRIIKRVNEKSVYFCKGDSDRHKSNEFRYEDWTKVEIHQAGKKDPTIELIPSI